MILISCSGMKPRQIPSGIERNIKKTVSEIRETVFLLILSFFPDRSKGFFRRGRFSADNVQISVSAAELIHERFDFMLIFQCY